jgi:Skp family chaperone for outer membrane proteins
MRVSAQWVLMAGFGVLVWCVSAGLNHAQPAGLSPTDTQVAVVNLVILLNEFDRTKVLNEQIKEQQSKHEQEKLKRARDLDAEKKAWKDYQPYSDPWKQQRDKCRKMEFELRAWDYTEKELRTEEHFEEVTRTYGLVTEKIKTIAQREGYELVMTQEHFEPTVREIPALLQQIVNRKVVYAHPSIDLTQRVLRELNDDFERAGGAKSINLGR